jgi:hypothetical protein
VLRSDSISFNLYTQLDRVQSPDNPGALDLQFGSISFCYITERNKLLVRDNGPYRKLPYFFEYSVNFYTLKMMLKYSLHTIHGR